MRPDRERTLRHAQARVGSVLKGKWTLDYLVGLGGMAAVYAATHRNRKRVAVKILHPELSAHQSLRERFQREGYVANTVKHPGVVSIDDDDVTDDGCAFLVMELLDGETLETRLERRGLLTAREVLAYANQVLDTLCTAHARGVVHRDIKPDNLLLASNGVVKILDFGISQVREGDDAGRTRIEGAMGTPAFMAPEQAEARWDAVDAQSDLWAVGATMFTLLTGHYIRAAETESEALAQAMLASPPSPRTHRPDLDDDVTHIVERALECDKSARWPDAATMLRAVREAYYARDKKSGSASKRTPGSERAPGAAWHRALQESWHNSEDFDDRDTLETAPPSEELASPHGSTDEAPVKGEGLGVFSAPPAAQAVAREFSANRDRMAEDATRSSPTASPRDASRPSAAPDPKERLPVVIRHAHTTTARAVAASPRRAGSTRWSLALSFLGVVVVVVSVVFTVRRGQNAGNGEERQPRTSAASTRVRAVHPLQGVAPSRSPAAHTKSAGAQPESARVQRPADPDFEVFSLDERPLLTEHRERGRASALPGVRVRPGEAKPASSTQVAPSARVLTPSD